MAGASKITPAMITSANLNQQAMLASIQVYQPAFQLAQVQTILGYIADNESLVPQAIGTLAYEGFSMTLGGLLSSSPKK